ncbi:hypothetical protein DMH04_00190 [Kibdelosporangium aridum]|uniref:Uncharacterized protein n=1 Tax=Kibdelosporangium aridum TaxID=2030 RepID=A0A428ZTW5_KIBAR|nr:hypothetical protein [Kibdelosporangium aridum]RSM91467.1 hypothetical protein DMH04_00190 [Kibdelosporangium aridum]
MLTGVCFYLGAVQSVVMIPGVEPLSPRDKRLLKRLAVYNGYGRKLFGFTRPDRHGVRYATVWKIDYHMPLRPLGRYCLVEETTWSSSNDRGGIFETNSTSRFQFLGATALNRAEIVRTYLWAWLFCPAVVAIPCFLCVSQLIALGNVPGNNFYVVLLTIALFLWPLVAFFILKLCRGSYQKRYDFF